MKLLKLLFPILFIFFKNTSSYAQNQIINSGHIWKYFDQGNIGSNDWKNFNYNDISWSSGPSELGYGDNDEQTIVGFGGNSTNKHITTYFRTQVFLNEPVGLTINTKFDDGIVIYLNGIEVYRNFMPSGTINFNTLATSGVNENQFYEFTIPVNFTQSGNNIIAVEVHQVNITSSDLSFDLRAMTIPPPPAPGLYINEVMASNQNSIVDNTGSKSDWIEIFNNNNFDVNLSNYYLTDSKNNFLKFRFPAGSLSLNIPAGAYKIIYLSGETNRGANHTSFSLSKDGEFVGLTMPDGITLVDSLTFGSQRTDVSYGRGYPSIFNFYYYDNSTPGSQNIQQNGYIGFLNPPTFSHESGFYSNPFNLSMSSGTQGSQIYYSTDASEPLSQNLIPKIYDIKNLYPQDPGEPLFPMSQNSFKSFAYNNSLSLSSLNSKPNYLCNFSTLNYKYPFQPFYNIPKANVIRAISTKPGFLGSQIVTKTYINQSSGYNHYSLPVFSLNIQEDFLYEYNYGITTPGNQYDSHFMQFGRDFFKGNYFMTGKNWERRGNFELFVNQVTTINKEIDLRMHGKYARHFNKKSFRVYFNELESAFPGSNEKSGVVILKNPSPRLIPYHDVAMRTVKYLNLESQQATPIIGFINGEYWGIYNIMKYFNEETLSLKYDKDEENFQVYKDGIMDYGSESDLTALKSFLNNNSFSNQSNYDSLKALIDIDNFIEYTVAEIFNNNTDWHLNNTFLWRYIKKSYKNAPYTDLDGRWRWVIIDFDDALRIPEENTLQFTINHSESLIGLILRKALVHAEFKNAFINKYADLLNSHFKKERTLQLVQQAIYDYSPELQKEYERWDILNPQNWTFRMNQMFTFFDNRTNYVINHIRSQFGIPGTYNLILHTDSTQGFTKINSIIINNTTPGVIGNYSTWQGVYFDNIPVKLTAQPKIGYKLQKWIVNGQSIFDQELLLNTSIDTDVTPVFEELITTDNPIPVAYLALDCPYQFKEWSSQNSLNTFPNNIRFVYFEDSDPGLNSKISGFTSGRYDHTSKTRINGLGTAGVSFINTNSDPINDGYPNAKLGGLVLALDTRGLDSIKLQWLARTITANPRKYGIRLQYREGNVRAFKDFDPIINYSSSSNSGDSLLIRNIKIPQEIIDKPYVQLIWRYYYTGIGTSGARDQLGIDNISLITYGKNISSPSVLNYQYGNNIQLNNIDLNAKNSIILLPSFETTHSKVFKAEIKTCP